MLDGCTDGSGGDGFAAMSSGPLYIIDVSGLGFAAAGGIAGEVELEVHCPSIDKSLSPVQKSFVKN